MARQLTPLPKLVSLRCNAPPELRKSVLSNVTANGAGSLVLSDTRLKTGIEKVSVAANGLPPYTVRYLWSDAVHKGVMAQVLQAHPEAMSTMPERLHGREPRHAGMWMTER